MRRLRASHSNFMSYTFLPYAEQRGIQREYRIRVLIVLFFFISISFVIGVGSLFPAYVYSVYAERLHLGQVAEFKKSIDAASLTSTQQQLAQSAALLNTLDEYLQPSVFYMTINTIVSLRGPVTITGFTMEYTVSPAGMKITLSGTAPTRNDLLSFKSRLIGMSKKVVVDLPISALTRDTDIHFSIQVTETL